METKHNVQLTSAEIANIWTAYQTDSLSICTLTHFLDNIQDSEIRPILEYALQLSKSHIQKLRSIYTEEQLTAPDGFTIKNDYHKAPRLYTDEYYLFNIQNMGKLGMEAYTLALSNSTRLDICEYFTECLHESTKLYNKATEQMLNKGLFIRPPSFLHLIKWNMPKSNPF
ncbi:DUF3231 family protein [Halobacillus shinanisalinarum]|uniref:DUF3231 family protein n=1 Tax=Halobacillus shinanisalinarum TaxID=2932258 RepID=A0ABY4GU86_9BACI|nr:DUF3231 family protein [Halobacillus shinanisalinarum]UOQ91544.1 DUF3231 family protein [Halobacillus shinanisalinarum]